ncbi:MAG: FAD-binding oxidoreductase [Sphingomonadaceae bacterium]|nr:FAD-binding oxidoreductase [Sphingomonadaceae bacterium]
MIAVDVAIVGAGIAGAGLAAAIGDRARVLLIEAEAQPGYHATGRSAAFWQETYGGPGVQPLTTASGPWLAAGGYLRRRGALHLDDAADGTAVIQLDAAFGARVRLVRLGRSGLAARVPGLRAAWQRGLFEPSTADIDVAALHEYYLAETRRYGVRLLCDSPLRTAVRERGHWRIEAGEETIAADLLVNAAGAWADRIAILAGAPPLGIRPYRRTVVQLAVDPPAPADMPLVIDAAGRFYFKPEAGGRLWLSPHDETPCDPCDAAPEEIDVARAIDRLERVVDWRISRVERSWAGLRSFAPDRLPVYGFDPRRPGFFWCAGQGGFGIQTAPAGSALAASLLLGLAPDGLAADIDAAAYAADRFAR